MAKNSVHVDIVRLDDGREVCLSYGVIVAAFIPGRGYLQTDRRWSVTTSRHMNQFTERRGQTVPHKELLALCAPLQSRE